MIDFVLVGKNISERRRQMGLSQDELADLLFVTRQALSKWERGISVPSLDTLAELSRLFGVSFEEILGLGSPRVTSVDENDIFEGRDRGFVLSGIASGEIKVELDRIFGQLSPKERIYILKHIKEGELPCDINALRHCLDAAERKYLGV